MNLTIGVVALALGVALVLLGMPKKGVSPAFMRNGFMEMVYPAGCLLAFVLDVAGILSGLS